MPSSLEMRIRMGSNLLHQMFIKKRTRVLRKMRIEAPSLIFRNQEKKAMRVTFIHNPSAGEGSRADADEILALIRAAGHQVTYQSAHEKNWHAALKQPADLVAVAGGDGTVSKVSRRLVGQHMPVAVLPRGTANNLAHTLDLMDIPLPELIAGWATARHVPFDVGVATCPWDEEYFLESVGIGLFAWTTSRFDQSGEQGTEGAKNRHEELRAARA